MFLPVHDHIIYILEDRERIGIIILFFNQRCIEAAAVAGMAGSPDL